MDGLGRNAAMYCVHGNTPAHTECLEVLIRADCDLDLKANGIRYKLYILQLKTTVTINVTFTLFKVILKLTYSRYTPVLNVFLPSFNLFAYEKHIFMYKYTI